MAEQAPSNNRDDAFLSFSKSKSYRWTRVLAIGRDDGNSFPGACSCFKNHSERVAAPVHFYVYAVPVIPGIRRRFFRSEPPISNPGLLGLIRTKTAFHIQEQGVAVRTKRRDAFQANFLIIPVQDR